MKQIKTFKGRTMKSIALNEGKKTEQQLMLKALAALFDGKNLRYFIKENNEIWFVAKDVVEAVGGVWHSTRFKEIVGEGCTTETPLKINGISQQITIAPHKTILKWLTLSRLPKAEPVTNLVWDILDKVFKGEEINVKSISDKDKKLKEVWTETIKMVKQDKKWGGRFIKFLTECGMDRERYTRLVNNFFDEFHGDYEFKKDIIHKMRANFQTYRKEALINSSHKDVSIMNVILLEVETEIENLWAKYEAKSRGQLVRHIKAKEQLTK